MKKTLFLGLFLSSWVSADIMNLNNYMPTKMEDATPIEERTMDLQYSAAFARNDQDEIIHRYDLRYGLTDMIQLEGQGTTYSGGDELDSGATELSAMFLFYKTGNIIPELSLIPTVQFPTGKKFSAYDYSLRMNLTSTLAGSRNHPLTQMHGNIMITHHNEADKQENVDGMSYIFGFSFLVADDSAVVLDGVIEDEFEKGEESYLVELGLHRHLGSHFYLGSSLSVGIGSSAIKRYFLLALEKQF